MYYLIMFIEPTFFTFLYGGFGSNCSLVIHFILALFMILETFFMSITEDKIRDEDTSMFP